jgi:glucan biosynthesis protein C
MTPPASLMRTSERIYYLDYLRGLMVLWVVLDHSMHAYTRHFADTWFIQDFQRSDFLDLWHLHNDAIMMPFMFFLAGLFLYPSLERRGVVAYIKERFIRLGIPLLLGVIFIAPFMTYDKSLLGGSIEEGYWQFWQHLILDFDRYPLDRASASGFWFLTYLLMLTFGTLIVYGLFPWIRKGFSLYSQWIFARPFLGMISLVGIACLLNGLSECVWGSVFWFTFKPFFGVRKARFLVKIFFFLMGVACSDGGFLTKPELLRRLKNSWLRWFLGAFVILCVYLFYVSSYVTEGAYAMPLVYYKYNFGTFPDWSMAVRLMEDEGLYALGRSLLLGLVMVNLSFFYLSFFARFLNRPSGFWQSLALCSYGIYIFHEPFVTFTNRILFQDSYEAEIKFLMAAALSLSVSWILTHILLRYLPGAKRIL